jgi:hypothetical protein
LFTFFVTFKLVCFEEKVKLLWLVLVLLCKNVAHYSKGINMKLGILSLHDKVQLLHKGT